MSERGKRIADKPAIAFGIVMLSGAAIMVAVCASLGWFIHNYLTS
jgi:hypothetical protein